MNSEFLKVLQGFDTTVLMVLVSAVIIYALLKIVGQNAVSNEKIIKYLADTNERNAAQDDQQQTAWRTFAETQRRFREDIEQYSAKRIQEANEQREAMTSRLEILERKLDEREKEVVDLKEEKDREIAELQKEIATLRRQLAERDKQISNLTDLTEQLTTANETLAKERDDFKGLFEQAQLVVLGLEKRVALVEQHQKGDTDQLTAPAVANGDDKADDKPAEKKAAA